MLHAPIQELPSVGGVQVHLTGKQQPDIVFFMIFSVVLNLFTEGSTVYFKESTILFQSSRGGQTFSRGRGPTVSRGGGGGGDANAYSL